MQTFDDLASSALPGSHDSFSESGEGDAEACIIDFLANGLLVCAHLHLLFYGFKVLSDVARCTFESFG